MRAQSAIVATRARFADARWAHFAIRCLQSGNAPASVARRRVDLRRSQYSPAIQRAQRCHSAFQFACQAAIIKLSNSMGVCKIDSRGWLPRNTQASKRFALFLQLHRDRPMFVVFVSETRPTTSASQRLCSLRKRRNIRGESAAFAQK